MAVSYLVSDLGLPLAANYAFGDCRGAANFATTLDDSYTPSNTGSPSIQDQIANHTAAVEQGVLTRSTALASSGLAGTTHMNVPMSFGWMIQKSQVFSNNLSVLHRLRRPKSSRTRYATRVRRTQHAQLIKWCLSTAPHRRSHPRDRTAFISTCHCPAPTRSSQC